MKPIGPNTRIESLKAYTPPSSGDLFTHPSLGTIKLLKPAGGDSWLAHTIPDNGNRFAVRPHKLQRYHSPLTDTF